ncbi:MULTISPECIES: ABC transporter permease [unclassified Fusibacter]|uniref:ABC transporter permease n=1 Tax=unclassified Fusibacter TaxID=2624464 RepID=UPI0010108981|nr:MULTISPECIES: ABC transporter permease [unclassified Fusibacter]MCK8059791.1 ABC transporter permease [Fusibacter sp. A2]NPE21592.1 ABC transporter permease [Fusibacter sp. A1]RXV61999.1 ABC transporter permease [Fusibacter sp. A1]
MMFINLLKRDLKTALSDRQAILTLIVMPIILVTILSFALSGIFEDGAPVSVIQVGVVFDYEAKAPSDYLRDTAAVLLLDDAALSQFDSVEALDFEELFMTDFLGAEEIEELVSAKVMDRETAYERVKEGSLDSVIIFDGNFYSNYMINSATPLKNQAPIQVVSNNDNYLKRQIIEMLVDGFSTRMEEMWTVKNLMMGELLSKGDVAMFEQLGTQLEALFSADATGEMLAFSQEVIKGRTTVTAPAYYTMAMLAMFLLFTAGYGSRLMLEEQEAYTLQRLHMTGVSRWMILMSKFVLMFLLGMVQLVAMVMFSSIVLGVVWGSLLAVVLTASASIFAVAGMGLMIAVYTVRTGNFKVANMLESFIFQVMAFLGGSFIPLSVLPGFFKTLSKLTVNGLTMNAFLQNMQGFDMSSYRSDLFALIAMGTAFLTIAIVAYGRKGKTHENTIMAET